MSDLIDRDKLKERLFPVVPDPRGVSKTETSLYMQGWNDAITSIIQNEPSAEQKKVVIKMDAVATGLTFMPNKNVGKWEERSVFEDSIQQWQSARCSVCEKYHTTPYLYYFDNFNYCPNCGARMVVEE